MHATYVSRLARLRKQLRQAEIPSLLVTKYVNVTYLTGFTGDDSYLLVTPQDAIILSDFRYITQLQEECPGFEVEIRAQGVSLAQLVAKIVTQAKLSRLGVEGDSMSVGLYQQLVALLVDDLSGPHDRTRRAAEGD